MHLGFIGLGNLGKAVAGRLLDCGHSLTVWNRTSAKVKGLEAEVATSPAAVAESADVIFVCMFDSDGVRSIMTQENGLFAADLAGKTVIDLTTNHFKDVAAFHEICTEAGATYLEAPVIGTVAPAMKGLLTVLISGEQSAYENLKPLFENIGKNLFYLGEPALATKMKLINNLTVGSFTAVIAETLSLGERAGLDKSEVLEILSVGGGNSMILNAKRDKLLNEDFSTHFSCSLIYKDLQCLQELAFEQKKPLFTGAVIKELYARTFEEGFADEDLSAVYKLFK